MSFACKRCVYPITYICDIQYTTWPANSNCKIVYVFTGCSGSRKLIHCPISFPAQVFRAHTTREPVRWGQSSGQEDSSFVWGLILIKACMVISGVFQEILYRNHTVADSNNRFLIKKQMNRKFHGIIWHGCSMAYTQASAIAEYHGFVLCHECGPRTCENAQGQTWHVRPTGVVRECFKSVDGNSTWNKKFFRKKWNASLWDEIWNVFGIILTALARLHRRWMPKVVAA